MTAEVESILGYDKKGRLAGRRRCHSIRDPLIKAPEGHPQLFHTVNRLSDV